MKPLIDYDELNVKLLASPNKFKQFLGMLLRINRQSMVDFAPGADREGFGRAMQRENTKVERVKDGRDNLPQ